MRPCLITAGERGRVRSICFARSPPDTSEPRDYISRTCHEFVDVSRHSFVSAAAEIRSRRVQILVDLNGHCGKPQFELLALRAAPLQLTYMGHPGTRRAGCVPVALSNADDAYPIRLIHHITHQYNDIAAALITSTTYSLTA